MFIGCIIVFLWSGLGAMFAFEKNGDPKMVPVGYIFIAIAIGGGFALIGGAAVVCGVLGVLAYPAFAAASK